MDLQLLEELPDDPNEAGYQMCVRLEKACNDAIQTSRTKSYDAIFEMLTALRAIATIAEIGNFTFPEPSFNKSKAVDEVHSFVQGKIRTKFESRVHTTNAEQYEVLLRRKFEGISVHCFSKGDVSRMQQLVNELRDLIAESADLTPDHRRRLLRRLEKVQVELGKDVSDLDRFWGFMVQGAALMEMYGKKAEPMVKRMREISDIVWRAEARLAELPSSLGLKLLQGAQKAIKQGEEEDN